MLFCFEVTPNTQLFQFVAFDGNKFGYKSISLHL
jgi:hypothetical protein